MQITEVLCYEVYELMLLSIMYYSPYALSLHLVGVEGLLGARDRVCTRGRGGPCKGCPGQWALLQAAGV